VSAPMSGNKLAAALRCTINYAKTRIDESQLPLTSTQEIFNLVASCVQSQLTGYLASQCYKTLLKGVDRRAPTCGRPLLADSSDQARLRL